MVSSLCSSSRSFSPRAALSATAASSRAIAASKRLIAKSSWLMAGLFSCVPVWNARCADSGCILDSPAEIKPAITQNVNGSRQILGFASSPRGRQRGGFLLLTGGRAGRHGAPHFRQLLGSKMDAATAQKQAQSEISLRDMANAIRALSMDAVEKAA